jgi:hypothetical protein
MSKPLTPRLKLGKRAIFGAGSELILTAGIGQSVGTAEDSHHLSSIIFPVGR